MNVRQGLVTLGVLGSVVVACSTETTPAPSTCADCDAGAAGGSGGKAGTGGTADGGGGAGSGTGGSGTADAGGGRSGELDGGDASASGGSGPVCSAGLGDCNHRADDGCETNVLRHPNNCGACGHDCQGATCSEGLCDAIRLGTDKATAITVGGANVYWVSDKGVRTAPKTGLGLRTLAAPEPILQYLTYTGGRLFYGFPGNIYNVFGHIDPPGAVRMLAVDEADAGGPDTVFEGSYVAPDEVEYANVVTTDADNVYWEMQGYTGQPTQLAYQGSAFWKRAVGGGTPSRVFPDTGYIQNADLTFMIASNGYLYGAGGLKEALVGEPVGGWILRLGTKDGSFQKIWQDARYPAIYVAAFGDYVYFTAGGPLRSKGDAGADAGVADETYVYRIPAAGGAPESLWGGGGVRIAVDASGIYVTSLDGTELIQYPLGGGEGRVLLTGHSFGEIALDQDAIYFTDEGTPYGVWKVVKPAPN